MTEDCGCEPLRVLFVSRGLFDESDSFRIGFQVRTFSEMQALTAREDGEGQVEVLLLDFEEGLHSIERGAGGPVSRLSDAWIDSRVVRIRAPRFKAPMLSYPAWALESVWGAAVVAAVARRKKADLIHTHGEWATFASIPASKALRLPLVYETHGIVEELFPPGQGLGIAYRAAKLFESVCIRNSSHLIVVSKAMKAHLGDGHAVGAEVVPCSVDPLLLDRDDGAGKQARRELALEGRFVAAYSGSFFPHWQQPDKIALAFKEIGKRIEGAAFLVLSTDETAAVRAFLLRAGLEESDLRVMKVDHADVPAYLAAADVGLLIRNHDQINQVACPVKFGEYLACGVPVLCTRGIGDVSELARDRGVGLAIDSGLERVDWDLVCEELRGLAGRGTKERCREVAREMFSWEANSARIAGLYRRLVAGAQHR